MLTGQDLINCQNRIAEKFNNGDSLAVWETVRNPDNVASRKHIASLDANAPSYKATIRAWSDYLTDKFPDFGAKLKEKSDKQAAESAQRQAEWDREQLTRLATSGERWNFDGTICPNSLEFVRKLFAEGWTVEKRGLGTVRFINVALDRCLAPMRNANINAAIRLLGGLTNA